jgi:hypothetical protein
MRKFLRIYLQKYVSCGISCDFICGNGFPVELPAGIVADLPAGLYFHFNKFNFLLYYLNVFVLKFFVYFF